MISSTGNCKEYEPSTSSIQPSQPCHHLEYHEIIKATENFSESSVIGSGGFGKVYKGNIVIGASLVVAAIKRLDSTSNQGAAEFWAEVEMFSMLRHCNLVSLIGYCNYEKEMILVYEYIPNGTLSDHLHNLRTPLSWLQRLNICIGAGRGLHYLHTGTGIQSGVIHRDVKSSNILLHESWAAKLSDFGLSKISPTNQPSTYVNTLIKGTFGYLDPSYFATGRLTRKSDVYAFGVVLLEVLCRKRAVDRSLDEEQWNLVTWAQDSIKEGNLKRIIDIDIRGEIFSKCLNEYIRIAERCLHNTPKQRPTMAEVVVSLESVQALQEKFYNSLKPACKTMFGRMRDKLSLLSIHKKSVTTDQFFTTQPHPCDPSNLPLHHPNKEFDARYRDDEARRLKAEAMKAYVPEFVKMGAWELKAQSKAQGPLIVKKYNPLEENGIAKNRFAYYKNEIHQSAVETLDHNLEDGLDLVPEAENVEATPAVVCETDESPEEKVSQSASLKEESNVVGELPDPQNKALDELKQMVQEALNKHEFTAPPTSPADEIPAPTPVTLEQLEAVVEIEDKETAVTVPPPPASEVPVPESEKEVTVPEPLPEKEVAVPEKTEETEPELVSIWGIPLLADERSDVVLLKFLHAREFKVKEAFAMLKNVVVWRKQFGIESLLEEDLGTDQEKVVYMHGVDKEGHPVFYNAYGEYQNKELYNETFSTEEKRTRFLRWRIQFLEKSIRKLDFSPDGICTIVQVIDFKNSLGQFKWELRQATNQALQLFQDNYPEFIAKQVFINVPFLYLAFYKLINPFFTQRTKSKFVFAGPSKTAETLFKYIAPELVPVQYGGLSREGDQEFTSSDSVTEEVIKPATKHTIEFPAPETCTLVWEARVVGYEMTYGAEFVPESADSYTVIVQKSRKLATTDEPVIRGLFKCDEPGKVVLTFDNQSSKKKVVMYRCKTKVTQPIKR